MAFNRFDRWVQITGALGIVAGLLLVGLELKQSALLTRAELGAGSMAYRQTILGSVQGEGVAAALAQSLENPEALSTEQQLVLDAWYHDIVGQVLRQRYLLGLGVFEDPFEPFARIQARAYFGNGYAQAWWRRFRSSYPDDVVAVFDPVIDSIPPDRDWLEFQSLRGEAVAPR